MRLPPFSALRCVEAVVRLGSATRAARELSITQSAVSRQIIDLERTLGTRLFDRDRGRLVATPAGRLLSREVGQAFARIAETVATISAPPTATTTLTLSMLPSVAAKWFVPRMMSFVALHPDIELVVTTSHQLVDFARERVDVAIRYGIGRWSGVEAHLLGGETIFPVCSPAYAAAIGIETMADLSRAVLLHSDLPEDWRLWFRRVGVEEPVIRGGPRFTDDGALLEAAIKGVGVALGRSVLVQEDLRAGRLVAPLPYRTSTRQRYWFVWPSDAPARRGRAELLEWLRREFARHDEASATPVTDPGEEDAPAYGACGDPRPPHGMALRSRRGARER